MNVPILLVGMYVKQSTLDHGERGRVVEPLLLRRGYAVDVRFVED